MLVTSAGEPVQVESAQMLVAPNGQLRMRPVPGDLGSGQGAASSGMITVGNPTYKLRVSDPEGRWWQQGECSADFKVAAEDAEGLMDQLEAAPDTSVFFEFGKGEGRTGAKATVRAHVEGQSKADSYVRGQSNGSGRRLDDYSYICSTLDCNELTGSWGFAETDSNGDPKKFDDEDENSPCAHLTKSCGDLTYCCKSDSTFSKWSTYKEYIWEFTGYTTREAREQAHAHWAARRLSGLSAEPEPVIGMAAHAFKLVGIHDWETGEQTYGLVVSGVRCD